MSKKMFNLAITHGCFGGCIMHEERFCLIMMYRLITLMLMYQTNALHARIYFIVRMYRTFWIFVFRTDASCMHGEMFHSIKMHQYFDAYIMDEHIAYGEIF